MEIVCADEGKAKLTQSKYLSDMGVLPGAVQSGSIVLDRNKRIINMEPLNGHSPQSVSPMESRSQDGSWAARRVQVIQLASEFSHAWYDANAVWIGAGRQPDTRETLWLCFGLLDGDASDVALANLLLADLQQTPHHSTRSPEEALATFDIFTTNHSVQMLVLYADKLAPGVRRKLEVWARDALGDYPGDRQSDYQFHGANDNMPAKATMGLILGGEYFGDAAAVEHGLWNLRQLRDLLTRRGLLSEYTSPTYTPLSIINLTEVAEHARHPEARELAARCVERIWADALGHYHAPTGMMGGPYARAYAADSAGHLNAMGILLWGVFGDEVFPHPTEELRRAPVRLLHHYSTPSQVSLLAWLTSVAVTPPPALIGWMRQRKYPFHLCASAERGGDGAGEVLTTHYQEEEFAIGTAEGETWTALQSEAFFLQYALRQPVEGVEDRRTVFARYLINDQEPLDDQHLLKPHGCIHTVQSGRTVLALARPVLELEGQPISALKFSVILTTHFGPVGSVELRDGHVFIQDGPVFLALRPLNMTDWGRQDAVRMEPVEHYQVLSLYNYEGEQRAFTGKELGRTLNGFVAVVGLAREESYEEFCRRIIAAELLDYWHLGMRTTRYRLGDLTLGLSYAVEADRVRYATINAHPVERPIWKADGLPADRLPFLGGKPATNSLELPYEHLRVVWDPAAPWQIASQGSRKTNL